MCTIKQFLLILALIALAAVFGASLYQSIIEGPHFAVSVPESLEHFRLFMGDNNPGNFFRLVAPAAQILTFAALVLNWKSLRNRRWWLLAALALIVGADVITFNIHYPRNALMFTAPLTVPVDVLKKAAAEWLLWNHVRTAMVLAAFVCTMKALTTPNDREIQ